VAKAARSLAETGPDEVVTVGHILFECVQAHCAKLGVHEGDVLSVRGGGGRASVVRTPDGRRVSCPPHLARFVEVSRHLGP
jgi:hypothetical protein